jgi:uncharacterized membrane protein YebE (DUF533 family)
MSATKLLGQLLGGQSGGVMPKDGRGTDLTRMIEQQLGAGGLAGLFGGGSSASKGGSGGGFADLLTGAPGKAALAGGVLGVLLKGSKKPKKMIGSAAKMGGLGLIAGLAWRAYQQHQAQGAAAPQPKALPGPQAYAAPEGSAFLPASETDRQSHSRAILRAMIAAAKADGHVDEAERDRLHKAVDTLDLDAEDKAFLFDELRAPLDIAAVARGATTPELAAELYVASLFMTDETDATERAYLDRLASALNLSPSMARQIEVEVEAMAG